MAKRFRMKRRYSKKIFKKHSGYLARNANPSTARGGIAL